MRDKDWTMTTATEAADLATIRAAALRGLARLGGDLLALTEGR